MKTRITILLFTLVISSCDKGSGADSCGTTVADIAGNYRIVKIESVAGPQTTDLTDSYLEACRKDDIYHVNSDKTLVFEDAGMTCTPTSGRTGTWYIVNNNLVFTISSSGWFISDGRMLNQCNKLIVYQSIGAADLRITFARQ